jgi:hypothetical protein
LRLLIQAVAAANSAVAIGQAALAEIIALMEAMEEPGDSTSRVAYHPFALTDAEFHALADRRAAAHASLQTGRIHLTGAPLRRMWSLRRPRPAAGRTLPGEVAC